MIKINLLDRKSGSAGPLSSVVDSLGLADVTPEEWSLYRRLVLIVWVGVWAADYVPAQIRERTLNELRSESAKLEQENQVLMQELKTKEAVRSEKERIETEEAKIKGRLAVISSLDADRYRAFKVLDTVSLLIPERVWIERMTFSTKTLDVVGASWEFLPINDFVTLLKQSGVFDNVRLKQINATPSGRIVPGVPLALQTQKKYEVNMDIRGTQVGAPDTGGGAGAGASAAAGGAAPAPAAAKPAAPEKQASKGDAED